MSRDPRHVPSPARHPGVGALLAAGIVVALLPCVGACRRVAAPTASDEAVAGILRLQRSTAALERQLELARGNEFYLLFHPAAAELRLMLRGAELRRFAVLQQAVAYPRVSWVSRRKDVDWQGPVWSEGDLVPQRPLDRVVVNAEPPGAGGKEPEPPPIPPTAEELYRVPARYHIRFEGGLAVEIRPGEGDPDESRLSRFGRAALARSADAVAAVGGAAHDRVRLRLVLARADAESLYRSLPPRVKFLVLPDTPSASAPPTSGSPRSNRPAQR